MSEEIEIQEGASVKAPAVTRKLEEGASPVSRPRRVETKVLEPEGKVDTSLAVVTPIPHLGLTREEMNWAALAHASILLTILLGISTGGIAAILGPIVPAILWYAFREKSVYVAEQARQATIFQLAGILAVLVLAVVGAILVAAGWVVSAVLVILLVGLLLLPVMAIVTVLWAVAIVALPIAQVIYGCYAAVEAYSGRPFRYLWIADQIDRYQTQA
jgi:uncharacterized Tic20 family protein